VVAMEPVNELSNLLEEIVKDKVIKGIILTSKEGKSESTVILEESVNKNKLAAGSATLLAISTQMIDRVLDQPADYILSFTQNSLIITLPVTSGMVLSALLDREKAESKGVENYITKIQNVSRKMADIIELSEYPKKGLFINVKNAIPEAKAIAILTKEGIPLIVHPAEEGTTLSGMISAVFLICSNMISNENSDYSIIAGKEGMIITQQIDNDRLLAVAIPKKVKIKDIITKLKEVIKESET
jgi:predicted regulator of Ras-like GTPase activity (Roadblock/LC7/MglB family)